MKTTLIMLKVKCNKNGPCGKRTLAIHEVSKHITGRTTKALGEPAM